MFDPLLEIACFNGRDLIVAAQAGAERLEFCSHHYLGGLSPDYLELQTLRAEIEQPIWCMLRLKPDSFVVHENEWPKYIAYAEKLTQAGANGLVFGCLTIQNEIDTEILSRLCDATHLPFAFHRAFDKVGNYNQAIEILSNYRISHILSSGGGEVAAENADVLFELQEFAGNAIKIVAGGGVRAHNAQMLLPLQIHSSALNLNANAVDVSEIATLKQMVKASKAAQLAGNSQ